VNIGGYDPLVPELIDIVNPAERSQGLGGEYRIYSQTATRHGTVLQESYLTFAGSTIHGISLWDTPCQWLIDRLSKNSLSTIAVFYIRY
jgi:hypothetical protein